MYYWKMYMIRCSADLYTVHTYVHYHLLYIYRYSCDEGMNWSEFEFINRSVVVWSVITEPGQTTTQVLLVTLTHTRTYVHTHTHTYIHTYTYTNLHTHLHIHTYTYIHAPTHTYTHTPTHIHTHTITLVHTYWTIISFVCRLFSASDDSPDWIVIHVNFTSIFSRTCDGTSDYYQWTVSDGVSC